MAPHRWRRSKLSNDKAFAEKLRDVVALYASLSAHAIVLSADERSQIQALDRTHATLTLEKGPGGTMTHYYKGHRTDTLFAAHNVLDRSVIGRNMQRRWHQEFGNRKGPHFAPTSSSWLNVVEGFSQKLTRRRVKHGVY